MSLKFRYELPTHSSTVIHLGCLIGSASAVECGEIIKRHPGPIVIITSDMHNTLRLQNEIQQFTQWNIDVLSDWETLPYDSLSPHQKIVSQRLSTLYHLPMMKKGALILPVNTLMQKVCPADFLNNHALIMAKGDHVSRDVLRNTLDQAGYRNVEQVIEHGEYAIRGALIDLFPMGSLLPYRIDFFDNEIDSLRTFNIDTQRTLEEVSNINLLPAHEFPTDKDSIEVFRSKWRERFEVKRGSNHIYQQVSKKMLSTGIEYWQPLFFRKSMSSLFDYLPANTLFISQNYQEFAERFQIDIEKRYENKRVDPMRPLLPPADLWLTVEQLNSLLNQWPHIKLSIEKLPNRVTNTNLDYFPLPDITVQGKSKQPLKKLCEFIEKFKGTVIFSVENEERRQTLSELLKRCQIYPDIINCYSSPLKNRFAVMTGATEYGFIQADQNRALICESDLLGRRITHFRSNNDRSIIHSDTLIRNLAELRPGQPVVHIAHGVGRYQGLMTLDIGGIETEYLILTYTGSDKLYVPVSSLHLISRYSGVSDENAPLHRLGSDSWELARKKTVEKVRDVAAELLDIYSKRTAKPGFSFKYNKDQYQEFCQSFPFETTIDQKVAINAVLSDMCQPIVMDRLVCGDVGFGKTEVAMRASFLAVNNNKQVAILVPTTLLAKQHFDNFRYRFANWPINIKMLSRFNTLKEQQSILANTAQGKINILIGTHKLLQSNLIWYDLGLLVVDEEHRFGVRHKERIKAMRANIDVLTLTATPIPRTLNMAMSSMRDLSIIATPPAHRLAVKIFVRKYDELIIREAILREIMRGGQVYYLYNDVENIEKAKKRLTDLVPEAHIMIAHGQMRKIQLERVMNDFHHQRFNVLVCTTIIESGVDIPTANTIIIERADLFGLAQLYQLRGRVGRSHYQAYAYLLIPNLKSMTSHAHKRLEAISSIEDLGAGFAIATHDLEIRGAGELLGEDQSGQIITIGFTLYMELLERAVDALKKGREPSLEDLINQHIEVELRVPVLLPDDYIHDVNVRLSFYKLIASARQEDELNELRIELIDRFGMLPDAGKFLLASASIRLQAEQLGIRRIEAHEQGGFIEFGEKNKVSRNFLISLLQNQPQIFRLNGPDKLKFILNLSERFTRIEFINQLLSSFAENILTV
ncbi:Transcription-repair-coupling factor [Candidatus Hartigia pinicola]|nr:Transcription-repair-coupling factor [Candidatus Hartigia pinicola]